MKSLLWSGVLFALLFVAAPGARAQGLFGAPSAAQCQSWADGLAAGGEQALNAVTYGAIMHCPSVAPAALSGAIRNARASADTAYLGRLASQAGQVRDPAVFQAALEVAADSRASDRARVMGLLVTIAQLGAGQDVRGWTRPQLFTQALPAQGICGLGVGGHAEIDNGLPADADRQAARVIDPIRYANGEPALVQNLARCARSAVDPSIPPQVDTTKVRLDYVCGTAFRIQNHTGAPLLLSYVVTGTDGSTLDAADVEAPAQGGWTRFTVGEVGRLELRYDGRALVSAEATGKACGGSS